MAETTPQAEARAFVTKAAESLAAAEGDSAAGRYDACANRAYFCCFQAAVAALLVEGIRPGGSEGRWGHAFVQDQFAGILIGRRKRYPATLRTTLPDHQALRERADYRFQPVTDHLASRALQRARAFVAAVTEHMPWQH